MAESATIKTIQDVKAYRLAYRLAMEVFELTKTFPKEETYSLVDQLRRSTRSIPGNIREGYAKRKYEQVFIKHLNDALGSSEETRTWIDLARDCDYLTAEQRDHLDAAYDEVSAMLYVLIDRWQNFEKSDL